MANSSLTRETVGQFSFSISLPENSFIKQFTALLVAGNWKMTITTERGQIATVLDPSTKRAQKFDSLDSLAFWLAGKGVPEMSVLLPTMGGAE